MSESQHLHAAQLAISKKLYQQAHALCVRAIKQDGESNQAYFLLGIIHIELLQIDKAIKLLSKANDIAKSAETYAYLAKCHAMKGNMIDASYCADNAPPRALKSALAKDTVGVALSRVGNHQKAIIYFEAALAAQPNNAQYLYNYGVSLKFIGRFEEAKISFNKAIEKAPDFAAAHFALSDTGGITSKHNHIERLNKTLGRLSTTDEKLHLAHALAKEHEALGDFDRAFAILHQYKTPKYQEFKPFENGFDDIFNWLENATYSGLSRGHDSDRPIFVVGMPRSGTTLVERILSNHSLVGSGGELQDFGVAVKELSKTTTNTVLDLATLKAAESVNFSELGRRYLDRTAFISEEKKHVIDKLPFNFFYVSLICRAFPNAKVVILMRNPLDTCVGNYRQLFSLNSPYYTYAYDIEATGRFYSQFYSLMHVWQKQFANNVLVQSYETLVNHPEKEIATMLDFCNLAFEPQCLHAETNTAPVSTASKVQVREPINTRSVGRWKRYDKHLNKLKHQLSERGIPF